MQRSIENGNVTLATESFGTPDNPALLLVMGATASMLGWPDALCDALAARDLFVIRFDHRDTGHSTTVPPGAAGYAVEDMAGDVVAVLERYGLKTAHLAGMSLGGYLAQMVAVTHPDRVLTLTLIGSEPLGWDGDPPPHIGQAFMDHFGELGRLDWADSHAVTAFLVESERLCAAGDARFEADRESARVARILARTDSPASMFNHGAISSTGDWTGRFRDIVCPVLVIHGADDPILPLDNGRALAAGIPDARLVILPNVGHALPSAMTDQIAGHLAAHVQGSAG